MWNGEVPRGYKVLSHRAQPWYQSVNNDTFAETLIADGDQRL